MITSSTTTKSNLLSTSDLPALRSLAEAHLDAEIGFVSNREFVELGNPL